MMVTSRLLQVRRRWTAGRPTDADAALQRATFCLAFAILLIGFGESQAPLMAQGIVISGMGPVNRSMGGASTASPIDSAGALYWNPATIDGLPGSEVSFGFEAILPASKLTSAINAGALGGGFPPVDLAGSDRSESGVAPVPSFALVYKPDDSLFTFGLGLFGIGGFTGNYPASTTNPVLMPPPPNGFGIGRVSAQLDLMQIVPTVSCRLTERLSFGFAPTVTLGRLVAHPFMFASPDNANGDGFPTLPDGTGSRTHWGAGFQAGVYYTTDRCWQLGASFKSPQWFEEFRFNSTDELGRPRLLKSKFDYPMIVSIGAGYTGFEDTVLACDVRYYDYANTNGFRSSDFDQTGALTGLGWSSILGVNTGIQRRVNERLALRLGYSFNQNPIANWETSINVASALIIQHWLYTGLSWEIVPNWDLTLAYVHGFENQISGPIRTPAGAIPGTSVTSEGSLDSVSAGITVRL
jgi:long-chain fatty acid transport protein